MGGLSYVLVVYPDLSVHPVAVDSDCTINLTAFLAKIQFPDHSLYAVYPSWVELLPSEGVIQLPMSFETDVEHYRLQFFPSSHPPAILIINPRAPAPASLCQWNIIFNDLESKRTFDDILDAFQTSFCVKFTNLQFSFTTDIDTSKPILEQRDLIKKTIVQLDVEMSAEDAAMARQRMDVLNEILQTEITYATELRLMAETFNESFFRCFHVDPDVYRRTFKSIAEMLPTCEMFLDVLKSVGCAVESSIGAAFLEYLPFLKVVTPHVSNFSAANRELTELLNTNRALQRKVISVCAELFRNRSVESMLVTPVQHVPRYLLLFKSLIDATVSNHWDYECLKSAVCAITKLAKEVDETTRDRSALNMVGELQKLFKNDFQIVTGSRKYVFALNSVTTVDGLEGSLYLFDDLVLFRAVSPQLLYIPFEIQSRTKVIKEKQNLVVQEKSKLEIVDPPDADEFLKHFQETKTQLMNKICTFDGVANWKVQITEKGPETYRNAAMVSIFDDLYLFGGKNDDGEAKNDVWWYRSGKWEMLVTNEPPSPRFDCSMNVYEAKLIVFGGQDGTEIFDDLWEFDIPTLTWTKIEIPNGPSARFGHATAFTTTQLWLFGGKGKSEYLNDFYCCDLYESKWYKIVTETVPEPRAWHTAFWIQDRGSCSFTIFGGACPGAALSSFWVFDYDSEDWYSPMIAGDKPNGRYGHVSAVIDNTVYILGGRGINDIELDSYKIDFNQTPFKCKRLIDISPPDKFENGACVALRKRRLALYGGNSGSSYRGLWTIQFASAVDCVERPIEKKGNASLFDKTCLSCPVFNAHSASVSSTIDSPGSKFNFSCVIDNKKIAEISRKMGNKYCWKESCVTKVSENDFGPLLDYGRLVPDKEFQPTLCLSLRSTFGRPPTGTMTSPRRVESRLSTLFRARHKPSSARSDLSEESPVSPKIPMPVSKHSSCFDINPGVGVMGQVRGNQSCPSGPFPDMKRTISCDLRLTGASEDEKDSSRRRGKRKNSR